MTSCGFIASSLVGYGEIFAELADDPIGTDGGGDHPRLTGIGGLNYTSVAHPRDSPARSPIKNRTPPVVYRSWQHLRTRSGKASHLLLS